VKRIECSLRFGSALVFLNICILWRSFGRYNKVPFLPYVNEYPFSVTNQIGIASDMRLTGSGLPTLTGWVYPVTVNKLENPDSDILGKIVTRVCFVINL